MLKVNNKLQVVDISSPERPPLGTFILQEEGYYWFDANVPPFTLQEAVAIQGILKEWVILEDVRTFKIIPDKA